MINFGTKLVYRPFGSRESDCRLCGATCRHDVVEVRLVPHLYLVPLASGKLQGFEWRCSSCGLIRINRDGFTQDEIDDAGDLRSAEERIEEIVRILATMEYMLRVKPERTKAESAGAIAVGVFMLAAIIAVPALHSGVYWAGVPIAAVGALSLGYAVWHAATYRRRWASAQLWTMMHAAFADLRPTLVELHEAMEVLRKHRYQLAKTFSAAEVFRAANGGAP